MSRGAEFLSYRMESVQVLRGIAALFVVCQHICFLARGSFGVDLFFLISGFVIVLATEKSAEHFLTKRALRILPLYEAATLFTYLALLAVPSLFANTEAKPVYLLKSLLFIPFSQDGVTQPLLRVGWTVNYEVFFYLLFALSMRMTKKYRVPVCAGMLAVLALIGAAFPGLPEPFAFWTDSVILEFAVGMGLFYVVRAFWEKFFGGRGEEAARPGECRGGIRIGVYAGLCAASAAVFAYEWHSYENPALCALPQLLRWGLPSALLLLAFLLAGFAVRMPRFLVWIGDMSFSLYLIHYFPMRLLNRLLGDTREPGIRGLLAALAVFLATLAVSRLCYMLVEKKLTGFFRRRLGC